MSCWGSKDMKKLTRRDLFKSAGKGVVGGTVLAVGLKSGDASSDPHKAALIRLPISAAEKKHKIPIYLLSTATSPGPITMISAGEIMEWSLVNDCEIDEET